MDERKPGEDVDSSQWKDTIIYERTEGEYFPGTRVSESSDPEYVTTVYRPLCKEVYTGTRVSESSDPEYVTYMY